MSQIYVLLQPHIWYKSNYSNSAGVFYSLHFYRLTIPVIGPEKYFFWSYVFLSLNCVCCRFWLNTSADVFNYFVGCHFFSDRQTFN